MLLSSAAGVPMLPLVVRVRYLLALGVLLAYAFASYFVLRDAVATQSARAQVVTISGRQRMLSQQIVMYSDALATQLDSAKKRDARLGLMSVVALFRDTHLQLSTGDPKFNPSGWPSAAVKQLYFGQLGLDKQVQRYVAHAEAIASRPDARLRYDDPDLAYVLNQGPTTMLRSLDVVAVTYLKESRQSIATFQFLEIATILFAVLTLVGVWFWILEPQEKELIRRAELIRLDAERYAFLAAHDSLTGLLDRGGFRDATATLISDASVAEPLAFLLIDLDRFKEINDTLGHPVGDQVLLEVAARLRATARGNHFIARLGGDEFAIVCPGIGDEATVLALGLRLVAALAEPIVMGPPFSAKISGSIGVAFAPLHGATFDEVFAHADRAMYAAKADGRSCVRIFRPVSGTISVTS